MPAEALATEVVDSTPAEPVAVVAALASAPHASGDVGSESEVPDFAQWRRAAMRFAIWYFFLRTCAGPRRSEQRSRSGLGHPPTATIRRSPQKVPSNAWLDATESIPVDSNRHAQPTGAASLKPHGSCGGLTISVGAVETRS